MDFISFELLPRRAALDTGVMLRGFWPQERAFAEDPRTPICRAFVTSMLDAGFSLLVSAVSIAEALRFPERRTVPRVPGIEVLAFDDQAAQVFATSLRMDALRAVQAETGGRRPTILFDALIVASAVRYRADMIVSIDDDIAPLAERVDLAHRTPDAFRPRQPNLPHVG